MTVVEKFAGGDLWDFKEFCGWSCATRDHEKRPSPHTKLHEKYDTDCWQTSVDWKQLFETTSFYGGQPPAGLRTRAGIRLSRSDQVG